MTINNITVQTKPTIDLSVISDSAVTHMTLKEITDLLEVRHNDAMNVVTKMLENQEFGLATKISYPIISGKGREQLIETYQLDKRQSIAVAARLNTNLMMRIIDRWQELEAAQAKPLSPMEMVIWSAQQIIEQERKILQLKNKTEEQDERMAEIESRQSAIIDQSSYFSVLAFAINNGVKLTSGQASGISRKCGSISNELGITIGHIVDPRYGTVKTYHIDVLTDVFTTKGLLTP